MSFADQLHFYGYEGDSSKTLAHVLPALRAADEQRERVRMRDAQVRDALTGQGFMMDQAISAIAEAQSQTLVNSDMPALLKFHAYTYMDAEAKHDPQDRGLKQASRLFFDSWQQDPLGSYTIQDLNSYRESLKDRFPSSRVASVIEDSVKNVGFQTIANLPHLNRIAAEIVDQASYDRAIVANKLDTDSIEHIQAREYIRSIAERQVSDKSFRPLEMPNAQSVARSIAKKFAQLEEDMPMEPEDDMPMEPEEDMPMEPELDPSESEFPHDEQVEELGSVVSPNSQEELVVELAPKLNEGMEPSIEEEEPLPSGGNLPDLPGNRLQATLGKQAEITKVTPRVKAKAKTIKDWLISNHENLKEMIDDWKAVELYNYLASEFSVPKNQAKQILDLWMQNDGDTTYFQEKVQKVLTHQYQEQGVKRAQVMEGGSEVEMEGSSTVMPDPSAPGKKLKLTVEPVEDGVPEGLEGPEPMSIGPEEDVEPDEMDAFSDGELSDFTAKMGYKLAGKFDSVMSPAVQKRPNQQKQKMTDTSIAPKKKKKAMSLGEVRDFCAKELDLTPQKIEASLLGGVGLAVGNHVLDITADNKVVLSRIANSDLSTAVTVRESSIAQLDNLIDTFMAFSAAEYCAEEEEEPKEEKKKEESKKAYVLTTFVPEGSPLNAKRLMTATWKIAEDAQGEMLPDGRLAVLLPSCLERDVNRIVKVYAEVYGSRHVEAQVVTPQPAVTVEPPGGLKHVPPTSQQGPYNGATPTAKPVAGQPGQPQVAPQQTMNPSAQGFVQRNTDPFKRAQLMSDSSAMPMSPSLPDGEMGMPGNEMGGDMGGDMGGGSGLQGQDAEAVKAAMVHFRNMGMAPLEAAGEFSKSYAGLLEKYGDSTSPNRMAAEAAVLEALHTAFEQPVVVPVKPAEKAASFPDPKPRKQKDHVKVKMDLDAKGDFKLPQGVKSRHVPKGNMKKLDLSQESQEGFPDAKVPSRPSKGNPHAPKDFFAGSTNKNFDGKMEQASQETKQRSQKKAEIKIDFDPEATVDGYRVAFEDKISSHGFLAEAVAHAERLALGREASILINDGKGGYTEL